MKRMFLIKLSAGLLAFSILLTACGGGQSVATQVPAATQPPAATQTPAQPAAAAPTTSSAQPTASAQKPTAAATSAPYVPPAFTSQPGGKTTADGFNLPGAKSAHAGYIEGVKSLRVDDLHTAGFLRMLREGLWDQHQL